MRKKRKSSLITKIVILALAVYATITIVSLQTQIEEKRAEQLTLEASRAELEEENARLQSAIDAIGTEAGIADIAREKLGLVAPGEIVFYDAGGN